jgi:peptide/nickel transport system substrate-binding protein
MKITRRSALVGASAGVGSAALPRFAIAEADRRPSVVVAVQKISNTSTLEPLREQSSNVSERWVGSILETLIGRNQQGALERVPGLAISWSRPNETTLEMELRPGVILHNGDELTAEDVAFSFGPAHMFGARLPADIPLIARRHFPSLDRVEAVGRTKVRFITKAPDVTLEGRLSAGGAEIVSLRAWMEHGDWAANSRAPVGTGPYRVGSFVPDSRLVLESHDAYWGGRPPLKSVTFVEVPEVASRIAGLQAGEFDFACDIPPDQIATIEADPRLQVQGGLVPNHRILAFDKNSKPLENPLVRLAMAHAIDGQSIVDSLWAGRSRVPPGLQWEFYGDMFVKNWRVPEYNVSHARDLLRQASYKGEEIIYRVRNNYYTAEVDTAELLVEFWRQAGLHVRLEVKENWAQVLDRAGPRGVRDWSNSAVFDDPVSSIVNQHGPDGAQQTNGEWTNAEMNALSGVLTSSTDMQLRHTAFARMLQICEREDPAYIVLHQNAVFTALRRATKWQAPPSFFMDFSSRAWHA